MQIYPILIALLIGYSLFYAHNNSRDLIGHMPSTSASLHRREVILEVLGEKQIESQLQLMDELRARDITVGQSSVSRDLEALGVAKVRGRYAVIDTSPSDADALAAIENVLLEIATAGPNLTVVKTLPGGAQRVGHALDSIQWPEVVGTVAGDDTIFIATDSSSSQDVLIKRINRRLS